jgi:hypothetical protein
MTRKVGDRVTVQNSKSVHHGKSGEIVKIDFDHEEGSHRRYYKVFFGVYKGVGYGGADVDKDGWYATWELSGVKH